MFKFKYNVLVFIQMSIGIVNYILLLKVFGASVYSDAYLLTISSFAVLLNIIILPISQFLPFYNDLKVKSLREAHNFYNSSIFFAFIMGILFCTIVNCVFPLIIKLFALGIDQERFRLFSTMLRILSFGLIFYPVNQINEQLLNAEMKFSVPYILYCIPLSLITLTQIIMIKCHSLNIVNLVIAQCIGLCGVALFGTIYISKTLIRFKFIKWHKSLFGEIKNSSLMYLGQLCWGATIPILFNNFLVTFPKGYVSYFYYAKKIIDVVNNLSLGPSAKILRSKISKFIAQKDSCSIKKISKQFLLFGGLIFVMIMVGTYYFQTPILALITGDKLSTQDLSMISLIFLTLIPWYLIMFFENPFVHVLQLSKKAKEFFLICMQFLIVFASLLYIFRPYLKIYTLGFSISIAQSFNLLYYIIISKKAVLDLNKNKITETKEI